MGRADGPRWHEKDEEDGGGQLDEVGGQKLAPVQGKEYAGSLNVGEGAR